MMQNLKVRILNWAIAKLYKPINAFDILTVDKVGRVYLAGKMITNDEARQLRVEAKALESLRIWKILQETARQKANEKGMTESTNWEHTLFSKAMLHVIGIQQSIVNEAKKEVK